MAHDLSWIFFRMPKLCSACQLKPAAVMRYDKTILCRECFIRIFEDEVHKTITDYNIFQRGQKVAIGASGGKDSAVLAKVLQVLNERHDYGNGYFSITIIKSYSINFFSSEHINYMITQITYII